MDVAPHQGRAGTFCGRAAAAVARRPQIASTQTSGTEGSRCTPIKDGRLRLAAESAIDGSPNETLSRALTGGRQLRNRSDLVHVF
jgi:hypothetical protein